MISSCLIGLICLIFTGFRSGGWTDCCTLSCTLSTLTFSGGDQFFADGTCLGPLAGLLWRRLPSVGASLDLDGSGISLSLRLSSSVPVL